MAEEEFLAVGLAPVARRRPPFDMVIVPMQLELQMRIILS